MDVGILRQFQTGILDSAHEGMANTFPGFSQEDDDENGGVQQIVRCAMKTVAAACEAQGRVKFHEFVLNYIRKTDWCKRIELVC